MFAVPGPHIKVQCPLGHNPSPEMAHSSDGQRRLHTGEEIAASGGEQGQVGTNLFRLLPHEPSPGATGEAGILSPGAALGGKIHRLQSNQDPQEEGACAESCRHLS